MKPETPQMTVDGLVVDVVRKRLRYLRLGVYPPDGRVRVAAPFSVTDQAVRQFVVDKLEWIRRHRERIISRARESRRELVSGETHHFLGRPLRLSVVEHEGPSKVTLRDESTLELRVRPDATLEQREQALLRWYRAQLRLLIPPLLAKWESRLGVSAAAWGIRRMKTRWGSCSIRARRIWVNLELAKRPAQCLEYIVVHELMHLLEHKHDKRFYSLMDAHLPGWRRCRKELNATTPTEAPPGT
ncbi:MAG: M48 family metallopeptidase [Methanocella sp.]